MATINEFIRQKLLGTPAQGRVYANTIDQRATLPAIVFHEVSGGSLSHAGGAGGVAQTVVSVTAIGRNFDESLEVSEAIRRALDGYSGDAFGVSIQHCLLSPGSRRHDPYVTGDAEEQTRFGISQDFNIMHTELAPQT